MRTFGTFLKVVFQAVFLFGSETWVVTPRLSRTPGGFHDQVTPQFTGKQPRRQPNGIWVYLPILEALEATVLGDVC